MEKRDGYTFYTEDDLPSNWEDLIEDASNLMRCADIREDEISICHYPSFTKKELAKCPQFEPEEEAKYHDRWYCAHCFNNWGTGYCELALVE